ncbi:MAG: hypothetical protein HZB26_10650, partial [Candidatus Hydrogenedentes bacterium]|nr:hypothetical protein [Candidatus Hydrogenedentota bacterium]
MHNDSLPTPARKLTPRFVSRIDHLAMLIYVVVVYVWSLRLYPLGRDFAYLAHPGEGLPFLVKQVFSWEVSQFGTSLQYYHLLNAGLMYACMLLVYRFVNAVVAGPAWFGTLAATLFMSNPAHSEAMLNLCGVVELIPCLLALVALTVYAKANARAGVLPLVISTGAFALAVLPYRENLGLVLVIALYEVFIAGRRKKVYEHAPFALVTIASLYIHWRSLIETGFNATDAFTPLYFLFYPIGFLPETAQLFCEQHWVAWVAAGATLIILFLICRKTRRRSLVFGLLAMAAVRLPQSGQPVDPVHLVGGGQLLLANVFFATALASLFYRIMENPNWRATIVSGTTLLCMVFFGVEIHQIFAWRHAGVQAQEFQRRAAAFAASNPGESFCVLPDFRYYSGAPMCLSESIALDTLFSKAVTAEPLLPMHYEKPGHMDVKVESWGVQGGVVRVQGMGPVAAMPWPYSLTEEGATLDTPQAAYELTHAT